jgi:hypothetical protein
MTRSVLIGMFTALAATSAASAIGLAPVGRGFSDALYVAQAPGEQRLLVVTRTGVIRPITAKGTPGRPWLDIRGRVGSEGLEQGLLGLAFAPDFATSGRFYVNYTNTRGDTRVVEFRSRPNAARVNVRTARGVLSQRQPFSNHNGGNLQFGPDGMLYIGFGDGGGQKDPDNNGPNTSTWLAKILRIDVAHRDRGLAYAIPAGNPFAGAAEGRPEIWAMGLRNPWRFSFDRATGDMWIGDVGQNAVEEIDRAPAGVGGLDFGWSRREGTDDLKGGPRSATETGPVTQYRHGDDGCSVTGGYVLRGGRVPALEGQYVYGDWCTGKTWAIPANGSGPNREITSQLGAVPGLTSFGEDRKGNVYLVTSTTVKRIRA